MVYYIEMITEKNNRRDEELFELGSFFYRNKDAKFIFGPGSETRDEFFVFLHQWLAKEFLGLICKVDPKLMVVNVTETLLMGDFNGVNYDHILKQELNKAIVNEYRKSNLTKDMVLDLILEKGVDTLSEIEISILKRP